MEIDHRYFRWLYIFTVCICWSVSKKSEFNILSLHKTWAQINCTVNAERMLNGEAKSCKTKRHSGDWGSKEKAEETQYEYKVAVKVWVK